MPKAIVSGDVTSSQADLAGSIPDFSTNIRVWTICIKFTTNGAEVLKVNNVKNYYHLLRYISLTDPQTEDRPNLPVPKSSKSLRTAD